MRSKALGITGFGAAMAVLFGNVPLPIPRSMRQRAAKRRPKYPFSSTRQDIRTARNYVMVEVNGREVMQKLPTCLKRTTAEAEHMLGLKSMEVA